MFLIVHACIQIFVPLKYTLMNLSFNVTNIFPSSLFAELCYIWHWYTGISWKNNNALYKQSLKKLLHQLIVYRGIDRLCI